MVSFAKEAYQNMYSVINTIFSQVSNNAVNNGIDYIKSPTIELYPEQKVSIQKKLIQAFPVIKIILDKQNSIKSREKIALSYSFYDVTRVLNQFATSIDLIISDNAMGVDGIIINHLLSLLKAAPATVRAIYKFDKIDKTPSLLPENALAFFSKDKYVDVNQDRIHHFNPKWPYSPQKMLSGGKKAISDIGVVELISLFLSPDRVYDLLGATGVLRKLDVARPPQKPNLSEKQIVHALFSCYSIRIPKRIHNIQKDSAGVCMEIIQDLRKCPKDLYPVLPTDKQAEFNLFDVSNRRIFMRRASDKFPQLLISFFDSNNCFEKLRFGVHLGFASRLLHYSVYADGCKRGRFVKDNITCFSTLNVAASILDTLGTKIEHVKEEAFSYVRNGENFAMTIGDKYPAIYDNRVKSPEPDFWISKYELEAMAFYEYLCPGGAESIILSEYQNYKDGKRRESNREKNVEKRIEELRRETESSLEELEKKISYIKRGLIKIGSKRYKRIMANDLASFLMKDIVYWMKHEDKPSGLQYAVVKGMLACFDGVHFKAEKIDLALKNMRVDKDKHVILRNIKDYKDLLSFYQNYLISRKEFLSEDNCVKFLQTKLAEKVNNGLRPHPIMLPRHFFYVPIICALEKESEYNPKIKSVLGMIKERSGRSLNYIIRTYFEISNSDHSQYMYTCTRSNQYGYYRLKERNKQFSNSLKEVNNSNGYISKTVSNQVDYDKELALAKHSMKASEKAIRMHRIDDIILFMLAKRKLSAITPDLNLMLENITPNGEHLPENVVTQSIIVRIEGNPITIRYQSSVRDGYLFYRWFDDVRLQQYILDKSRENDIIDISSKEILKMYKCQLRN